MRIIYDFPFHKSAVDNWVINKKQNLTIAHFQGNFTVRLKNMIMDETLTLQGALLKIHNLG
jgi:Ran GTPase-activating protein (RanGAP) involved in mRNA processing and transport